MNIDDRTLKTAEEDDMLRKNMPGNMDRKRREAAERQAAYAALTVEEKLARLPKEGSARQRARLEALVK
jgi:hypothetical protein